MNAYFDLIIGMLIGSSAGVWIKYLALPPTSIAFFRLAAPLIVTFVYLKYKKIKLFTGNYKIMLLASLFNAIRLFFYFVAYLYTSITNAIIILFTWPIFAALFGVIFLKEKITRRQILLFAMAFSGIVFMNLGQEFSTSNSDLLGMGAMLISAIVLALANVSYKRAISGYSNMETIFYQNFLGAFLFFPFIFINSPVPTITQTAVGIFYALLIGIGAFFFMFTAMRKLKMLHYSLFKYIEVIFNIMFGVIFFSDAITLQILIGGGLIIAAGVMLRKDRSLLKEDSK
jgi:drug/metabolite transporter (DMT)-like permease